MPNSCVVQEALGEVFIRYCAAGFPLVRGQNSVRAEKYFVNISISPISSPLQRDAEGGVAVGRKVVLQRAAVQQQDVT